MNSLNPVHKVSNQLLRTMHQAHEPTMSRAARLARARRAAQLVGISADRNGCYAHELPGGMPGS